MTDDELWERTKALAQNERAAIADLIDHLAVLDDRKLYRNKDHHFASLFEYCVHYLGFSESGAYRRIRAARAAQLFPPVSVLLRDGRLTLESIALLHPHLEDPDAGSLIHQAAGLKLFQVQALLAGRQAEAPRRDVIRICGPVVPPQPSSAEETALLTFMPNDSKPSVDPGAPKVMAAPPPTTIRVSFSADEEFHKLMLRAKAVLRHKYPDGRLEGVLKDALVALLKKKDRGFRWEK